MTGSSERGAIFIHVAVGMVFLLMLGAFIVDHGVLLVSRGQAQNAADAGAMAAALTMMKDPANPAAARGAGKAVAHLNPVWGELPAAADVIVDLPIACPPGAAVGVGCVRVDVLRGQTDRNGGTHTNRLPVFFASLFGMTGQGVGASATSEVAGANATGCMRPWFVMDKYTDANSNDRYDAGDTYANPGYRVPADIGTLVDFHENTSPSGYGQLDAGNGGAAIRDAIKHCINNGQTFHIGESVPTKPGGTVGPERQGVDAVVGWDPYAYYDPVTQTIQGSCASTSSCVCDGSCPNGASISPRIAIVAICSPLQGSCAAGGAGNSSITITNFLSFFILGHSGNGNDLVINSRLIGSAGQIDPSGGTSAAPFLQVTRLVR